LSVAPAVQLPTWQVSLEEHALRSSQTEPSGLLGFEQFPVADWQVPALWHWSSGAHTTGFEPVQVPAWHVSVWVHMSASLQPVPSGLGGFEQLPLPGLQTPATWHWSRGEQTTGSAPVQTPAWHESVWVHRSPSSQPEPSGLLGLEQLPVAGLQIPATWHWSRGVQTIGFAPLQAPAKQVSVWVHGLPSSQVEPSGFWGFVQLPVAGLQLPASWHESWGIQTTGLEPAQIPVWQVSVWVHMLPSLQIVPLVTGGSEQTPLAGLHTPAAWHWSEAVHTTGLLPVQAPARQPSVKVHASPSSQGVPSGLVGSVHEPVAGLQIPALWQESIATHCTGLAPLQFPDEQVSTWVHRFPSLQPEPSGLTGLLQVPLEGLQTPALWQESSGVHITGFCPVHTPAWQESLGVHRLLSLQGMPSWELGFEQAPVAGLQTPASWHWSSGVQTTWFAPTQAPPWQLSVRVQASPSLQGSALSSVKHPVCASHRSSVQGFESEQSRGVPGTQFPAWQVSMPEQTLSSLQSASTVHGAQPGSLASVARSQSLSIESEHNGLPCGPSNTPGLTFSSVSSQSSPPQFQEKNPSPSASTITPLQAPLSQVSFAVQLSPSSQGAVL
jgi:hypothetical protein